MKNKKRGFIIAAVLILAAVILIACVKFYYREQSILDILPQLPESEPETVQIMRNEPGNAVAMSNELFDAFIRDMDQFQYQHVSDSFGMDSFGRIIYVSNGVHVEIMFSNERGGSILVNPMDREGNEPVYKITGGSEPIEKIFDVYLERAQKEAR